MLSCKSSVFSSEAFPSKVCGVLCFQVTLALMRTIVSDLVV